MSFASTDDQTIRKSSINTLKSRTLAIPTPAPVRNRRFQRGLLKDLSKPKGLIVTNSLPAECFSSPMLFIKLEKVDYEADKIDLEFISEYIYSHAIHKGADQLNQQVRAQEYIVNLFEKQVKYISLQRLPKNSEYSHKPTISFRDALQIITENNPLLVDPSDELSCYVNDLLRSSKVDYIESHQLMRIKALNPSLFRNQYLIRILNNKPPQDDKSANVAQRNRFKTRKAVKKQVSKRTSENQYTVFKLIQEKIREFNSIIKYKLQTEHLNQQHHCVDLNLQSIHQQNKQNQTRADERGPQHTLKEFLNLGLDNLTNMCIRPEMDVLKRKRSDVQNNNYEDSYTRQNDWKSRSIKEHINQFINVQQNNNKCNNDDLMNNNKDKNNNNITDNNHNNDNDNPDLMDQHTDDINNNLNPHTNINNVSLSSCNDSKSDKMKSNSLPKPLSRTLSKDDEACQHISNEMCDDSLELEQSNTKDQVHELYQMQNGDVTDHGRKGFKENFKRENHGRVDTGVTRK